MLISVGGLNLLTDPTFDPPGAHPVAGRLLNKVTGPAIALDDLPPIDAVLLSHEQHPDNLDDLGRALLNRVPVVYTTEQSATRLGDNAIGMTPWRGAHVTNAVADALKITAVPAHHGPEDTEHLTGHVIGFVLTSAGLPTIYVSGDNASLRVVREVAHHAGPIDVAVVFGGRARSPLMDAYLTLDGNEVFEASRILGARTAIPAHLDGWDLLTQGDEAVRQAFEAGAPESEPRLVLLEPGEQVSVGGDGQVISGSRRPARWDT
ncbi:MBL fold metallo-hydrolase [Mycobacterium montefiorense]|uniref:MBL fold metallo-hydrolase n=2 Tax=Mycobacterium montefiorense TaxID=154654 RepID=A0AA37PQB2_9MYCO|nr:MBL fold metallo-hydrolase [Mycobacterium montefiorense]GKU36271.1 MBL fold metallo-hydrolase [Mycobacterium montefiorense]GKU42842.1 MBL fold metallo-hydrolase [Mycobacterium montefiorense]GKU46471.1 MBL fold metallo-hydrolase [Mycobacterium montefiorense]GKU53648.1 MBL fold metallo-hydrolase [Mycobacterium montefiorense]